MYCFFTHREREREINRKKAYLIKKNSCYYYQYFSILKIKTRNKNETKIKKYNNNPGFLL